MHDSRNEGWTLHFYLRRWWPEKFWSRGDVRQLIVESGEKVIAANRALMRAAEERAGLKEKVLSLEATIVSLEGKLAKALAELEFRLHPPRDPVTRQYLPWKNRGKK